MVTTAVKKENKTHHRLRHSVGVLVIIFCLGVLSFSSLAFTVPIDGPAETTTDLGYFQVDLFVPRANDRSDIQIHLLRDQQWFEQYHPVEGGFFWLELPELGINAWAKVQSILPCNRPTRGEGDIVTGTFESTSSTVLTLGFIESSEHLQLTPDHQLFSRDRNTWVPAKDLQIGEHVRTQIGAVTLNTKTIHSGFYQVYNLEVSGDHSYYLTQDNILGHNTEGISCGSIPLHGNEQRTPLPPYVAVDLGSGWTPTNALAAFQYAKKLAQKISPKGTSFVGMMVENDREALESLGYAYEAIELNGASDVRTTIFPGSATRVHSEIADFVSVSWPNSPTLISEAYRILKPGGRVIVIEDASLTWNGRFPNIAKELLETSGFPPTHIRRTTQLPAYLKQHTQFYLLYETLYAVK